MYVDRTAVLADFLRPGNLGDERHGVRRTYRWCGRERRRSRYGRRWAGELLTVSVEGDQLVDAVEVPAVVRGRLIAPLDLAGLRVESNARARPHVVARTQVAVPRSRVAGAEEDRGWCRDRRCRRARWRRRRSSTGRPATTRWSCRSSWSPCRRVCRRGLRWSDATRPAHRRRDLAGLDAADDAELAARHAGDEDRAVRLGRNDERSGGVRVAGLEVLDLLLPNDLAGVLR